MLSWGFPPPRDNSWIPKLKFSASMNDSFFPKISIEYHGVCLDNQNQPWTIARMMIPPPCNKQTNTKLVIPYISKPGATPPPPCVYVIYCCFWKLCPFMNLFFIHIHPVLSDMLLYLCFFLHLAEGCWNKRIWILISRAILGLCTWGMERVLVFYICVMN